jgi:hypothetical protein
VLHYAGLLIVSFFDENELSWMLLANGSEAIRARSATKYAGDQTDASVKHNVDRNSERGNCASVIGEVNLCTQATQAKHEQAEKVNATGRRLRKGRLRIRLRCNTLTGDAGRVLPV